MQSVRVRPNISRSSYIIHKRPAYLTAPPSPKKFGRHATFSYEKQRVNDILPQIRQLVARDRPDITIIEMAGLSDTYNPNVVMCLQKCGDIAFIENGKFSKTFDFKFEKSASPNFFAELWSNKNPNTSWHKLGWVMTTLTDYILYSFEGYNRIGIISITGLRQWLKLLYNNEQTIEESPTLKQFRMVAQEKHQQNNKTVGVLIPFQEMPDNVMIGCIVLDGESSYYTKGEHFHVGLPNKFAGECEQTEIPYEDRISNLL